MISPEQIDTAFAELKRARVVLYEAAGKQAEVQSNLQYQRDSFRIGGQMQGKNAEERDAWLAMQCSEMSTNLDRAKDAHQAAKRDAELAQLEVDRIHTHLRLLELPAELKPHREAPWQPIQLPDFDPASRR